MGIKISTRKIAFILTNLVFTLLFFLLYYLCDKESISQLAIIGIIQYLWMISTWYIATKNVMNVYLFFLVLSFGFYLGKPVLYLFNIDENTIMSIKASPFSINQICNTLIYLLKAMALFHLGASFSFEKVQSIQKPIKVNKKAIAFVGMLLFLISIVPQMAYTLSSLKTTLTVGYSNIFDSGFVQGSGINGGIPRFLAGFFKASLLLLILGNIDNKKKRKFWICLSVIFSLLMIISGQRGLNSLFIVGLVFLYHYSVRPFSKKQLIRFSLVAFIGVFALSIVSSLRNVGITGHSFSEIVNLVKGENYLLQLLGEMGFTLIACTTVMVYSPTAIPFNDGLTYFNSLFALIPNLFWDVNPAASGGVDQVFHSFLMYNSGMGSSFIIEAYYNFGMYGLLTMPIFGYLIGKIHFSMVKASINKDYLKLYTSIYFSIIVLWFVRSETITFWRNFGYYILFPVILINLYTAYAKKKNMTKTNIGLKNPQVKNVI